MANQVVKLKKGSDYLYPYADMGFIDTSNIILSAKPSGATWTATEDCWLYAYLDNAGVKIDDVVVCNNRTGSFCAFIVPIKKSQVVGIKNYEGAENSQWKAYGLKRTTA